MYIYVVKESLLKSAITRIILQEKSNTGALKSAYIIEFIIRYSLLVTKKNN